MFDSVKIPAQNSVIPESLLMRHRTLTSIIFLLIFYTWLFLFHILIIVFHILIIVKGIWTYKYRLLIIIIIVTIIIFFIFNGITGKQRKKDTP